MQQGPSSQGSVPGLGEDSQEDSVAERSRPEGRYSQRGIAGKRDRSRGGLVSHCDVWT